MKKNSEPIIEVQDLSYAYQETSVLKNVNFSIFSGEFLGIIGPNGGGKTTLLRLLMGFLKPTSGSIRIFGTPPNQRTNYHISYVPQILRFDKQFPISVLELVLMGRLCHLPWYGRFSKNDVEAAKKALSIVKLSAYEKQSIGSLSGGQSQRALIARALVSEPDLLLLDEPTANVDTQSEHEIFDILKGLKKQMTILMVTHNLSMVIEHVERVLCVQREVLSLEPKEVCEHFGIGLYHDPLIQMPFGYAKDVDVFS